MVYKSTFFFSCHVPRLMKNGASKRQNHRFLKATSRVKKPKKGRKNQPPGAPVYPQNAANLQEPHGKTIGKP